MLPFRHWFNRIAEAFERVMQFELFFSRRDFANFLNYAQFAEAKFFAVVVVPDHYVRRSGSCLFDIGAKGNVLFGRVFYYLECNVSLRLPLALVLRWPQHPRFWEAGLAS